MQQLNDNPVLMLVIGLVTFFLSGLSLYIFLRAKKLRSEGVVSQGTVTHIFLQQVTNQDSKGASHTSLSYTMRYKFTNRAGNTFTEDMPITRAQYYAMGGSGDKVSQVASEVSLLSGSLGVSMPFPKEEHEVSHPIEIIYLEDDPSFNMPKNSLNAAQYWFPLISIFVCAAATVVILTNWAKHYN